MKAYFIFRKLSDREIATIRQNGEGCMVFASDDLMGWVEGKCLPNCRSLRSYQDEINASGDYRGKAIEVLNEWADMKVAGERFADFLSVEGISLFDTNFRIISNGFLRWVLMYIDLFNYIFKKHPIDSAVVIGGDALLNFSAHTVAKQLNIELRALSVGRSTLHGQNAIMAAKILLRLLKLFVRVVMPKKTDIYTDGKTGDKKKITSFLVARRHSNNLLPLLKLLSNSQKYHLSIINDLYAEEQKDLSSQGLGYRDLLEYLDLSLCLEVKTLYCRFTRKLKEAFHAGVDFRHDSFLLNDLVKWLFFGEIYEILLVSIEKIVLFKRFLNKERPDLILNCNDVKYIAKVASGEGIKCVGLVATTATDLLDEGHIASDKILVGSNFQRESLSKLCDASKIEVVGEVRFDGVDLGNINRKAKEYKISKRLSDNDKIVVFVSTYSFQNDKFYFSNNELEKIFDYVYKAVGRFDDVVLLTKMHPYERNCFLHRNLAVKYGIKKFILEKDRDIFQLLGAADVVIDTGSTIGLDAIFLGKPLITIVPGEHVWSDIYSFQREGLSCLVLRSDELYSALKENLYNNKTKEEFMIKRQRYLQDNLFDGNVNNRIGAILDTLIGNGKR